MKQKSLFCFAFMLVVKISIAQTIDWDAVRQRYSEKYQPQKVPAWLFPMIFKEGNGGRDTLYLGYDTLASVAYPVDGMFAETMEVADSSKFFAYFTDCCFGIPDTILKVMIGGSDGLPIINCPILFHNGFLPVSIYWDVSALHSDSLPYPDQDPAPRAEGRMFFDYPMTAWFDSTHMGYCTFAVPILITDSLKNNFNASCHTEDSIMFFDELGYPNEPIGEVGLEVIPWVGEIVGIEDISKINALQIFPNPANDYISIQGNSFEIFSFEIYDILGTLKKIDKSIYSSTNVSLKGFTDGVYLFHVYSELSSINKMIIIHH